MGKPISADLRNKLLGQKKAMSSGMIIENSTFEKAKLRFLPVAAGETPGKEYTSYYCERLKKGSTSPVTFGLKCPIFDFFAKLKVGNFTKEEKDAAYNTVKRTGEFWMPVIDMADIGTADQPNIRLLRAKKTVYTQVIHRMVDEEIGEDITDLVEGRPAYIKKSGQKLDTEWHVTWMDPGPVSDDPDYITNLAAIMETFDVASKFYAVKWDELDEIYQELTGEPIPEHYKNQDGAQAEAVPASTAGTGVPAGKKTAAKPAAAKPAAAAPKTAPKTAAKPAAAAPAPVAEEAAPVSDEPDANGIIMGRTRAKMVVDDVEMIGVVTLWNEADDTYDVTVTDEAGKEDIYGCKIDDFEILPEEEAAPAPTPAVVKKGPAKKAAPAAAAPAPAAAAPKPAASAGIKARLKK